jgi:hypothetical protein
MAATGRPLRVGLFPFLEAFDLIAQFEDLLHIARKAGRHGIVRPF